MAENSRLGPTEEQKAQWANDNEATIAKLIDEAFARYREKGLDPDAHRQDIEARALCDSLMGTRRDPRFPAAYMALYPRMVGAARNLGYALAVHGSLIRDCDLVAIPWTEEAAREIDLIRALLEVSGGHLSQYSFPSWKPHGRRAWSIYLGGGPYIDVSIMPRLSKVEQEKTI